MEIKLKEIELIDSSYNEFKKFIDNSYNEWTTNWSNVKEKIEKNSWKAKFEINYKGKIGYFNLDTEGDYLTYMDLEGYLNGEEFPLEDGLTLKLASHSSNILVAVVFSECIRLGLIDEDEESYLSMMIFPEWSRGLVPNDVLDEEDISEFYEKMLEYLINKNVLKVHKINLDDIEVISEDEDFNEKFLEFIKKYFESDLFFYTQNENVR